jgi:uncharacterized protein (TIGR01777 family)
VAVNDRMRVLITGATGFIGRALVPLLQREKHTVVVWSRSPVRARSLLGADVEIVASRAGFDALVAALGECDAIVNLAGEPLLGGRWTQRRRAALETSRVELTATLVRALAAAAPRPSVLVSASAVGFYGDRGDEALAESSRAGDDFLSALCQRWEGAALAAEQHGVRVVRLRTGVVLGRGGGALTRMVPPFRLGVGGPIGSGRQYLPWIHLHDLVRVVATSLTDPRESGPINAVAPEHVDGRTFAQALGQALHRPSLLPVPAAALKAIFGRGASVLLASQRVEAGRLLERGFAFEFPTLDAALVDILGGAPIRIATARDAPAQARAARYELRTSTVLDAPMGEAFGFFSKAENLGLITPAAMQFTIRGAVPSLAAGAAIDYTLRVGLLPVRWRTRITRWEPGRVFVDRQEIGPYKLWWHEHSFRDDGARTIMEDRVYYAPPLGVIGRLANRLFIVPALRAIFQYRSDVIRLRFGTPL